MKAELLLDYATFNFSPDVHLDCIKKILAPDLDLYFKRVGLNDNSLVVSPFGLSWLNNSGFLTRPCRLQVSGVGCSHFELLLPELRKLSDNHLSRVDFAFDVVVSRDRWRDFCINSIRNTFDDTRQLKRFNFSGSGEALTFYIGSRKCAKYCRIYNKSLEDPEYSISIPVSDDEYIIRYEVELKHFKGRGQNFDPSEWFDLYYSDPSSVVDFVKSLWRDYARDVLLLFDIDDLDLSCRSTNYKFCSMSDTSVKQSYCASNIYEYPQTFDRTISFVADRFGKYIPFILSDPLLRRKVLDKCYNYCGFRIDVIVSNTESGFYDIDDDGGDDCISFNPFEPDSGEQYFLDQCF